MSRLPQLLTIGKNAYFCRKRTFQHQTLFTSIIELSTGFKQGDNHESKGA